MELLEVENDVEGDRRKVNIHICHLCECDSGRGWCTNPLHMYIGTAEENCADKSDDAKSAGGKIGGKTSMERNRGLFDPKNKETVRKGNREGGKNSKGGVTAANLKRICLVTGAVMNPGNLARYQRKRGIDTHLYADLDGSDITSQTMLMGLAAM